jgi:hypothetical protein
MTDPLLAQSAIDRLESALYELVVEGESYPETSEARVPTADTLTNQEKDSIMSSPARGATRGGSVFVAKPRANDGA